MRLIQDVENSTFNKKEVNEEVTMFPQDELKTADLTDSVEPDFK